MLEQNVSICHCIHMQAHQVDSLINFTVQRKGVLPAGVEMHWHYGAKHVD